MRAVTVLSLVTCCGLMVAGSHSASAQSPISFGQGNAFGKLSINSTIYAQATNNVILSFKGATKDIIQLVVFAAFEDGFLSSAQTNVPKGAQLVLTNGTVVIYQSDGKTQWPNTNKNFSAFVNFETGLAVTQSKDTSNVVKQIDSDATTTYETIALTIGDTNFEGFVISGVASEKSSDVVDNNKGTESETFSATVLNGAGSGLVSLPHFGTIPAVVVGTASIKGKTSLIP